MQYKRKKFIAGKTFIAELDFSKRKPHIQAKFMKANPNETKVNNNYPKLLLTNQNPQIALRIKKNRIEIK